MDNYFVLDFKKIKDGEAFKNIIAGHNFRLRNYKNRGNINTNKTKNNIILSPLKFKTEKQLLDYAKQHLKEGKRQVKRNNAKAFTIVVDSSVIKGWGEQDYVEYLKEADKFFKDRFKNLTCLGSIIHMDESKPHLHISFSYFSPKEGAWIQKKLNQQGLTNFNNIYKDFEKEVGKKFGLRKGLNRSEKEKFLEHKIEKFLEEYKIKKGLFFKDEYIDFNLAKQKLTEIIVQTTNKRNESKRLKKLLDELKAREREKDLELNTLKKEYELLKREARKIYWEERNKVERLEIKLKEKDKLLSKKEDIIKAKDREIRELQYKIYNKNKNIKKQDRGIGF